MPSRVDQNAIRRRGVGLVASDPGKVSPGYVLFSPLTTNKVSKFLSFIVKRDCLINISSYYEDLPSRQHRQRSLSMVNAIS